METYYLNKRLKVRQNEVWARWKCRNAIKEGKKGFKDNNCRPCRNKVSDRTAEGSGWKVMFKFGQDRGETQS